MSVLVSLVNEFGTHVVCAYCRAPEGEWCMTASNKYAQELHTNRRRPFMTLAIRAWSAGYDAGEEAARSD